MGTELATVHVYSTDPTKNPAIIPLSTTFETTDSVSHCLFGYDTEAEGVLNFGEATVGTVTARILGTNVGTTSCALDSVMLSNDPNQTWYEYEVLDLGADPEGSGSPVNTFPLTFEPGQHVAVDVHYKAPGFSVLADLTLSFSDEQSHLKEIPLQGSGVPPCIEWAPGSVADPLPLQFVGEQASNVTRSFAVYNCGEGALALTNAWIEDDETPGEPSQHWTLLSSLSGYKVIPGNRVEVFDLAMYVTTNDTTLNGTLFVEHVDVNGPQMLSVDLQGSISATTVLPTADPGTPEDYADLVAGVPFILDGSASGAFAPAPAPEGYIWYLSNKPNNSALIVNGPPGPPQHIVTPDVEGYYTFSLIVHTAGDAPLYSSPGSVTVLVAPAPEPPPEEEGTP